MSSSPKVELKLDWCSHEAAKYAVEKWHYSRSMPTPPIIKIGVWENEKYIGCILFSRGGNNNLLKPFGLLQTEGCELTRIALSKHTTPVTRIVTIAIKMLVKNSPGMRLIVSYADPNQNHNGAIYQAGNWFYSGQTSDDIQYVDKGGRHWHSRQVSRTGVKRQYGELRQVPKHEDCVQIPLLPKHRYLYPLDDAMRKQIAPLSKPYPKRADEVNK
jgi:hypothetical protein